MNIREMLSNTVAVASFLLSILLLLSGLGMDTSVSGGDYNGRIVNLSLMRQQEQMFILGIVLSCVTGWWCTKRFESFLTFVKHVVRVLLGAAFVLLAAMTVPWEVVAIFLLIVFLVVCRRNRAKESITATDGG